MRQRLRRMTMNDKKCIVFLRYGSLRNFTRIKKGSSFIGSKLRISEATVRKFLKTFIAKGHNFDRLGHQRQRFANFTQRMKRMLIS